MHTSLTFIAPTCRWAFLLSVCCGQVMLARVGKGEDRWVDVSSALLGRLTNSGAKLAWPGGCSGVVANRLTGEVTIKVVGGGLWRSLDQGQTWARIDQDTISGRDETGWATSLDPDSPGRMASFSLDGSAGWSPDGQSWRRFADRGRNWDFGSVDWGSPRPVVIIAAKHETDPPGEVYLTVNGGETWKMLSIHLNQRRDQISMLGALAPTVFIHSKGEGIYRSTDSGESWTKVSPGNPQTRIPVRFRGNFYLGTAKGLLVSNDQGANWQSRGAPVSIWQGPFFGRDEKDLAVVGDGGIYRSDDGGDHWKQVAGLKTKQGDFAFSPNWFGCYAWDPVHNVVYASSMGNPVYKLEL